MINLLLMSLHVNHSFLPRIGVKLFRRHYSRDFHESFKTEDNPPLKDSFFVHCGLLMRSWPVYEEDRDHGLSPVTLGAPITPPDNLEWAREVEESLALEIYNLVYGTFITLSPDYYTDKEFMYHDGVEYDLKFRYSHEEFDANGFVHFNWNSRAPEGWGHFQKAAQLLLRAAQADEVVTSGLHRKLPFSYLRTG